MSPSDLQILAEVLGGLFGTIIDPLIFIPCLYAGYFLRAATPRAVVPALAAVAHEAGLTALQATRDFGDGLIFAVVAAYLMLGLGLLWRRIVARAEAAPPPGG